MAVVAHAALSASIALGQGGGDVPQAQSLSGDQVIPIGEQAKKTELPGDPVIPAYPIADPNLRQNVERAREAYDKLRAQTEPTPPQPPQEPAVVLPAEPPAPAEPVAPKPKKSSKGWTRLLKVEAKGDGFRDEAGGVRVFTRNLPSGKKAGADSFTLPSTSIALATLLFGIEATSTEERLVPAELNYAWLGPNGAVVEMKNCRLWVKVKGDYSTERIYGTSETISCRSPAGETFDIPISAHMVDKEEEYLGARGELVARGKALASALSFLSDGVQAFGNAMASAQVQTEVAQGSPYGGPVKGSNVGGDKTKYIAGQTVAGSTAKFLDWWIDYYQSLSPTIAIGPGKKIYLAVHGTVEIPKIFFGAKIEQSEFEKMAQGWKTAKGGSPSKVNTTQSISKPAANEAGFSE